MPAAVQGVDVGVNVLVTPIDRHAWGWFGSDRKPAEVPAEPQAGDEDLYELDVVETFLHRGHVFPANGDETVAAQFRY